MLIGSYAHTLDPKGRVFVPAKFRDDLGEKFMLSQGSGKCLFVFSAEAWEKFVAKLTTLPLADRRAQSFFRLLCASATECDTDKQGRVVIPQRLREYAGLEKDVLVNGVVNRAEIWSKENWDDFSEAANDGFEETLEKLMELGI